MAGQRWLLKVAVEKGLGNARLWFDRTCDLDFLKLGDAKSGYISGDRDGYLAALFLILGGMVRCVTRRLCRDG